jgi:acetylornithine/N-succinyldiaminopimelate aminotransferase
MNKGYLAQTYKRMDLVIESGQGTWLQDSKGEKYLDMVSGIAVNALGHNHPALVKTIKEQSEKMLHVSNLYWTKEQADLSERLISLSNHAKIFFCNSGSEAVEGAIKTAKKYGQLKSSSKKKVICFDQSFHGRTIGALSLTAQKKYQMYFEPLMSDVIVCAYNELDDLDSHELDEVCGIIVEPIQGEGGIQVADQSFLEGLRKICNTHDILLIFDEVQCGAGRMGTFFAYESFGVVPDIVCMAKGLGGGVPIGAFILNDLADVLDYGDHGCTYGGNPFVCAVSTTVVDIVSQPSFLQTVKEKSNYLINGLENLMDSHETIQEVRGKGLMLGLLLNRPAIDIIQQAAAKNVLTVSAGEDVLRIVPPLNITYDEMDLFLKKMKGILNSL